VNHGIAERSPPRSSWLLCNEWENEVSGKFWHEGLNFECHQCGWCCTFPGGAIYATEEEFHTIAAYLGLEYDDFLHNFTKAHGEHVSLISREEGPCIFYKNGCSVYPVRPTQCRTFPFWPEITKAKTRWDEQALTCQGIGKGRRWSRQEIREQLNQAKKPLLKITPDLPGKKPH
jgi:Fe-S-cluster containining protein